MITVGLSIAIVNLYSTSSVETSQALIIIY